MSLLLDALKKAAEQKAAKSRQEDESEASSSDETMVTGLEEETSLPGEDAGNRAQRSQHDNIDETELDYLDSTQTQTFTSSESVHSEEDETIVLDAEDVTNFMGEPGLVSKEPASDIDATELDQTEYLTQHEPHNKEYSGDDTELDQTEYLTQHDLDDTAATSEPTELDQTEYQTRYEEGDTEYSAGDTELDQTEYQTRLEPDDIDSPGGDTELDQTEYQTQHEQANTESHLDASGLRHDATENEDLSLLLVDRDDTNLLSDTSLTDPQNPRDKIRAIAASGDTSSDEFELVEKTQLRTSSEETETASAMPTNGIKSAMQTNQQATTQVDSLSTQTYAPDNYDRTLMKLPSDDASRLFAGMKSDADVVMTPDYAKKVFSSKSAAHRMKVYQAYFGIGVVILLSIGIFGAFEFQAELDSIDSSLRPLKQDPMPGIIKPDQIGGNDDLFPEVGNSARTIEIIEGADSNNEVAVEVEETIADSEDVTVETVTTAGIANEEASTEIGNPVVNTDDADLEPVALVETVGPAEVAEVDQVEVIAVQPESKTSTLKIVLGSQVEQKNLWLREAYEAYKSGNNSLAMTRYNKVLEVDPGNRNALLARAAINVQSGNSDAAIKDYQTLLFHNPKDSLAMTSLIAVANLSPAETESRLKLMIRDEPDSPYLNFALANAYGAQNRWQEAQGYYFKALENNPRDPNYAYNLAVSLEHIAQPRAAVLYYQRALENFDNNLANFNRDIVSQRVGVLAIK